MFGILQCSIQGSRRASRFTNRHARSLENDCLNQPRTAYANLWLNGRDSFRASSLRKAMSNLPPLQDDAVAQSDRPGRRQASQRFARSSRRSVAPEKPHGTMLTFACRFANLSADQQFASGHTQLRLKRGSVAEIPNEWARNSSLYCRTPISPLCLGVASCFQKPNGRCHDTE